MEKERVSKNSQLKRAESQILTMEHSRDASTALGTKYLTQVLNCYLEPDNPNWSTKATWLTLGSKAKWIATLFTKLIPEIDKREQAEIK